MTREDFIKNNSKYFKDAFAALKKNPGGQINVVMYRPGMNDDGGDPVHQLVTPKMVESFEVTGWKKLELSEVNSILNSPGLEPVEAKPIMESLPESEFPTPKPITETFEPEQGFPTPKTAKKKQKK